MKGKSKFGFLSIVLLGINAIIGSGIFLLPNSIYKTIGSASMFVVLFDMFLVISIALCFAEAAGMFKKNGGPYIYAKEAFGDFIGFEVGFMKWSISIIAWSAMSVAFTTALSKVWPEAGIGITKNIIVIIIIGGLGFLNYLGVKISELMNNIVTLGKLIPLIIFVAIGIFFIKGGNFSPMFVGGSYKAGSFGSAALIIFYAFTGFESLAVAAEDMEKPEKNVPRALITVMLIVSAFYLLILAVCIGTLGPKLADSVAPVADAAGAFMGPFGSALVTAGTLISIGGINIAASFITPRSGVALAEGGMLPKAILRNGKHGTPTWAIFITVVIAILVALSGSFSTLAAISVISRFAQYLPTCLAIPVLRKTRPDLNSTFRIPFGPVIPVLAIVVSIWMLTQTTLHNVLFGLGGLIIGIPIYLYMTKVYNVRTESKAR